MPTYASFKYGSSERVSNGRFFNDYTEGDIGTLLTPENQLTLLEYWITEDVRPERSSERWLNFIANASIDCSKNHIATIVLMNITY